MEKFIKTYVEKVYSGSCNELVIEEVEDRDPTSIENDGVMMGFYFYDKEFVQNGETIISQKVTNRSKFVYCGERLSLEEIKLASTNSQKYGSLESLIKRMETHGNQYACYTQGGCMLIMRRGEMTYDELLAKKKNQQKCMTH